MGDDRPYALPVGDGHMVELPVHWSLDDAPYFAASPDGGRDLRTCGARAVERPPTRTGHITLTLHPEILGRPHRADVLRAVLQTGLANRMVPARTQRWPPRSGLTPRELKLSPGGSGPPVAVAATASQRSS